MDKQKIEQGDEIVIRPATEADVPALGLMGALMVKAHMEFDPARFLAARPGTEHGYAAFLRSQLREPDVIILVAERNGEVVGYSYSALEGMDYQALRGPGGMIHDLLVNPTQRGGGIGHRLLEATQEELRKRGARQITLFSAEKNDGAQRLFEGFGFRRTMVEMTKDLE